MKGDRKDIAHLNRVLLNELTAINRYFLHTRMLGNLGLKKLEHAAHAPLKEAIAHREAVGDDVSRELLEDILESGEEHIDQMRLQNWLQAQAGS